MTVTDTDVQALVGPQFHALAEVLAAQPEGVADAPSLCDGWAVRHVVAHLTMAARYDGPAFAAELASVGYDFETLSTTIALRDGDLGFDRLLADLRSDTMAAWAAPGGGAIGALTHVVIHGLDATAALHLPRSADDEATRLVLDRLTLDGDETPFGIDLHGWQLTATDLDWKHGVGTPVSATAEDLVLALAGRPRPGIDVRRVDREPGRA
jgi:uncharacterized protein (TIGR03083 family)